MYQALGGIDVYRKRLAAYPGIMSNKPERVNRGGRILLPSSCLAELSTMNVAYPLHFRIRNRGRVCYAGVLEFNSENGVMIMPEWMFSMLALREGDAAELETCVLPPGRLIKLRPQELSFVKLQDPKLILERHLSDYPALTRGTSIIIQHAGREFVIDVTDITDELDRSVEAISTVRSDALATELKVEFERPLDMPPSPTENEDEQQQQLRPAVANATNVIGSSSDLEFIAPPAVRPPSLVSDQPKPAAVEERATFTPFAGGGRRINDKPVQPNAEARNGETVDDKARDQRFQAFAGTGRSLR